MNWSVPSIQHLIRVALEEDRARADVTTRLLIDPLWRAEGVITAKQRGIVAGLPFAQRVWKTLDPTVQFKPLVSDGKQVRPGQKMALVKGKARTILAGERPALNALQHLSGIATFTHDQVNKLTGTRVRLCDTRKTLPGWRLLQKYAVRCGGGTNQRMSLEDSIMIKENHLQVVRLARRDWLTGAQKWVKKNRAISVQMEVQTDHDLRDAVHLKPDRVLLDNLPAHTLKRMARLLRKSIPGVEIEFTGGVRPENLRALARLGPDRISMGRLTHSVPAFDCSLDITRVQTR